MLLKKWLAENWFTAGLAASFVLAWVFPEPGAAGGLLYSQVVTRLGVVLIFFFQGLTLSPAALHRGALQWRLHLMVQSYIFLLIPLTALLMVSLAGPFLTDELRLGVMFLAVLPTTIATSVAYTAMTGGNVSGAVFNSTFSNIAGIFITPLWVGIWLQAEGETLPVGKLFLDISLMLLAPLLLGQILRPLAGRWAVRLNKGFSIITSLIILFIVYAAFCDSWDQRLWSTQGNTATFSALAVVTLLLLTAMALTAAGTRLLGFNHENSMAALFCAPQKTLAAGAPMANLIFAGNPGLGLILLPIMFYHPLQLIIGGICINRVNRHRGG